MDVTTLLQLQQHQQHNCSNKNNDNVNDENGCIATMERLFLTLQSSKHISFHQGHRKNDVAEGLERL